MLRCADGGAHHLQSLRASAEGRSLAGLLAGAAAPVMVERSFRLTAEGVAQDRFLLSLPARAVPVGLLAGLAALGLPAVALEAARAALPAAAMVHLGLETGAVLKLYLERPDGLAWDGSAGPPLHRAWKWRPATGQLAMDRYMLVPPDRARERLMQVPAPLQSPLWNTLGVLGAKPGWLFLLDVLGEGARRSLDIRCYDFARRVSDLVAPLSEAATILGTPAGALDHVMAQRGAETLGHVAFGLDAQAAPFVTVYAGAEQVPAAGLA